MAKSLLLVPLLVALASAQNTAEISKVNTALNTLAGFAETAMQSKCTSLFNNCGGACSIPACGSTFSSDKGFTCRSDFGTATCQDCEARSLTDSAVRMPLATSFTDADTQAFICATKSMDTQFKTQFDSGNLKGWQYVAHGGSGSTRLWPGAPQGRTSTSCEEYDARLRPWYASASSGPKDVVLLIDASTSMLNPNDPTCTSNCENRWAAVRKAVKAIYGTLTPNDYVATVLFGSTTRVIDHSGANPESLLRADIGSAEFDLYATKIDSKPLETQTNMIPGFDKAFDILSVTGTDESSGCTKIILFLTDGDSTDEGTDLVAAENAILGNITAKQTALLAATGKKANIFTYSMGGSTDTIPKAVACANDGVWNSITPGQDPLVAMRGYSSFLASSSSATDVRWTAAYDDAFGLGEVVTAARPIYDNTQGVPIQVGVVATDILVSTIGGNSISVVNALINEGKTCPALNLTECALQNLRDSTSGYTCPTQRTVTDCRSGNDIISLQTCTPLTNLNNIMCPSITAGTLIESGGANQGNEVVLCIDKADEESGGSSAAVVGGVIGGIVVVGLIIGVIAYCVMAPKKPTNGDSGGSKPNNSSNNTNPSPSNTQHAGQGQGAQPAQPVNNAPAYPAYPQQNNQPAYPAYPQQGGAPAYPPQPDQGGNWGQQQQQYPAHTPPPAYGGGAPPPAV